MRTGWEIRKLGDFSSIKSGKAIDASEISSTQSKGLFPCFGGNGIRGYVKQTIGYGVMPIIGRVGALCGNVQLTNGHFYATEHALVVNIKETSISPYWYKYALSSMRLRQYAKGVAQPVLAAKELEKLSVPVPPIAEQGKIVAELDCLAGIIEKKKQQLEELDKLAQSIFYDMFGDPITNEKGWEVKKLGDVCTIERGGSPRPITAYITDAPDGINWIKIGDAREGSKYITSTAEKIKPEGLKKSRFVHNGDFILSNSMSFGRPYILGVDGCIHDGWLVIRDNENTFDKIYLYYYLSSGYMYGEFKKLAVGGVVNNLNSNLVRGVRVLIPGIGKQRDFAAIEKQIETQKELIKKSIQETETLFNSRMDYWFN